MSAIRQILRETPSSFRRLSAEDRQRIAGVARVASYARGDTVFGEGRTFGPLLLGGLLGPGEGRQAAAERQSDSRCLRCGRTSWGRCGLRGRPFPASAVAMEDTTCIVIPRGRSSRCSSIIRRWCAASSIGLTCGCWSSRKRLAELSGGRVETRFARLFLKLAEGNGLRTDDGVFVPLPLSRQELADMTGDDHRNLHPHRPADGARTRSCEVRKTASRFSTRSRSRSVGQRVGPIPARPLAFAHTNVTLESSASSRPIGPTSSMTLTFLCFLRRSFVARASA